MKDHGFSTALTIYTDGACSPNPGPGGWGAVIIREGKVVSELSGGEASSTNNRMELTAAVEALQAIDTRAEITLYTDSIYLKNGITEWIIKWQSNNWQTADRKDVKNSDLWKKLLDQIALHRIDWRWVKGHGSNPFNIRADELAVAARKKKGKTEGIPRTSSLSDDHIRLFTGVTCRHKAGVGAWSAILNWRSHVKILGARVTGMSANQLYLMALVEGLKSLKKELPVNVYTHSGYLYDGATTWLDGWKKRDWRTREGRDVSNKELWQAVEELMKQYRVSFYLEDRELPHCFLQEAKELAREFEQGD